MEKNTTHRYGPNTFKLHRMPVPRPGQVERSSERQRESEREGGRKGGKGGGERERDRETERQRVRIMYYKIVYRVLLLMASGVFHALLPCEIVREYITLYIVQEEL